jgi:hypothetical protein
MLKRIINSHVNFILGNDKFLLNKFSRLKPLIYLFDFILKLLVEDS